MAHYGTQGPPRLPTPPLADEHELASQPAVPAGPATPAGPTGILHQYAPPPPPEGITWAPTPVPQVSSPAPAPATYAPPPPPQSYTPLPVPPTPAPPPASYGYAPAAQQQPPVSQPTTHGYSTPPAPLQNPYGDHANQSPACPVTSYGYDDPFSQPYDAARYQTHAYDSQATLPGDQAGSAAPPSPKPMHDPLQYDMYPSEDYPKVYGDDDLHTLNDRQSLNPPQSDQYHQQYSAASSSDGEEDEDEEDEEDMPSVPGAYNPVAMEEGEETGGIRYGRIPQRVPRRYKTMRKVDLFQGNLVLDCPVPSKLLDMCADKTSREFTHMRYTAATCEPDNFADELYELRQTLYDPQRQTELFICLTMYNEDEVLFTRTMHHVMENIAHLCSRKNSKTWGAMGWKKVVVCIVSDGRKKINSRTLAVLAAMGVYQEGVAKNVVNGKPVTAHIYEYTAQVSIDEKLRFRTADNKTVPVQILFCLKERNQKKINSHRWFFNAFGRVLEPSVCILIDVGTMPRSRSIYHLWKAFDVNQNVGGACGEIVALKGKFWSALLNPLVGSQNFEYKMSNILDKPLESAFGYITVLPGAFSAYRYVALQNDETGAGPLKEYFKGETMHGGDGDADIFTSNMYLAEDRILCWELVAKRGSQWVLHYVKTAQGVTDVPDTVAELIGQRRRWLNGSFFASLHSIVKFYYIYRSAHSFWRKFFLHIEMIYQAITLLFSFFSLSNFFIAFWILTRAVTDEVSGLNVPNIILTYIYLAVLLFCFLLSLGNRPAGNKWAYMGAMIVFAILTAYMTAAAIALAILSIIKLNKENKSLGSSMVFIDVVVSFASTYGIWLLASLLWLDPFHMFTSLIQYVLMAPSMINVINVYAFSNTHDVSWGTKGSDSVATDLGVVKGGAGGQVEVVIPTDQKDINELYDDACAVLASKPPPEVPKVDAEARQKDYYAAVRTNVLLAWVISNIALAVCIINVGGNKVQMTYMGVLLWSVAGLAAFKFCGQLYYLVGFIIKGA